MISSLAWVPAGVADPNPKKYEQSPAEQELIEMMMNLEHNDDDGDRKEPRISKRDQLKVVLPPADASQLPADLRMDDYSDDDDDDDENEKAQMAVGSLLLGGGGDDEEDDNGDDDDDDEMDEEEDNDDNKNHNKNHNKDDDIEYNSDEDDDDDLADVPDTREFMPTNMQGLRAMNIGGHDNVEDDDLDDDDSELEDTLLTADDALVLVAKTEEDFATLEVHVYDTVRGNLYVHHDIPLPAYPLCVAPGQVVKGGQTGNYCAVGTFHPGIEIWNLDVLNALEPSCILGGPDTSATDELLKYQVLQQQQKQQNKKQNNNNNNHNNNLQPPHMSSASKDLRPGSHTDAVLSLSWNQIHKQVIASASADSTVKLWDVTTTENASTFTHHNEKVNAVRWNPSEATLLATASYDKSVALLDARSSSGSNHNNVKRIKTKSDLEALAWDPHNPERLTIVTEDGTMTCFDVRNFNTKTPLWSMDANDGYFGGVHDLCYNTHVPGFFATCSSIDKSVTLWDAGNASSSNTKPKQLMSKDMCAGKLFSVQFYPSLPWLLATGGSGNQLALWDLNSETKLHKVFENRTSNNNNNGTSAGADNADAVDEKNEEDLQAMLNSNEDETGSDEKEAKSGSNKKKKKKKSKRKAHKKG